MPSEWYFFISFLRTKSQKKQRNKRSSNKSLKNHRINIIATNFVWEQLKSNLQRTNSSAAHSWFISLLFSMLWWPLEDGTWNFRIIGAQFELLLIFPFKLLSLLLFFPKTVTLMNISCLSSLEKSVIRLKYSIAGNPKAYPFNSYVLTWYLQQPEEKALITAPLHT